MEKPTLTNHLKFTLVDSHHNLFHWLVVVFTKVISFLILAPLSTYIVALGFFLSSEIIQPYLFPDWFEVITFYSAKLPYFHLIQQFILGQLNHWYQEIQNWRAIVVGIPLIILGVCLFIAQFFNLYYSVFSTKYNRTHCPFCKKPIKLETN